MANPNQALFDAANAPPGRVAQATRAAIAAGADVNAKDASGTPALILAIKKELPEMFTILRKKGADVEATDAEGRTALMVVPGAELADTRKGVIDDLFLNAQDAVDVNALDGEGKSVLTYALDPKVPDEELVEFLIERGVTITRQNAEDIARKTGLAYMLEGKQIAPGGRRRKTRKTRKLRTRRRRTMRR